MTISTLFKQSGKNTSNVGAKIGYPRTRGRFNEPGWQVYDPPGRMSANRSVPRTGAAFDRWPSFVNTDTDMARLSFFAVRSG